MRGARLIGEALSPHSVCPSCARRLLGQEPIVAVRRARQQGCTGAIEHQGRGMATVVGSMDSKEAGDTAGIGADASHEQQTTQNDSTQTSDRRRRHRRHPWDPPIPTVDKIPWEDLAESRTGERLSVEFQSRIKLPLHEKRRLASLPRADIVGLLNEYVSEYGENIFTLFEEGRPDMVMHAFLGPEKYRHIMYNLPDPMFAEAFRLLSPQYFVEPYKKIHRYFHPSVVEGKRFRSLRASFGDFERMLLEIVMQRRKAGFELGLTELTHLLDCARAMGNGPMAEGIWAEMQDLNLEPTTTCYNHYMAAKVWDGAFFDKEKFNVRVTAYNMKRRSLRLRKVNFTGYSTGPMGVHRQVVSKFDEMIGRGTSPDQDTFINLMTAFARVGDIENVKKVFRMVWNIDVDGLMTYGEERLEPVRSFARSSPLHPTNDLLFAIAHVFGSNNDFMTALQLVDYVSRQYSIRISMAVWQELLEWAYVLSLPRFGPRMEENSEGQIPREVVTDILRTMSAPPYRVVPNMVMVNIMAKHAFLRNVFSDLHKYMEMGYKIFLRTMKERNRLRRTLVRHELCIAPMPTVSEQEAWEMRERLYLQRLEEELEKERRKRNGEAVDDTAVGSTDRQQQQQRETEDWVDDVALPAKEGEGELHRYHQLAYLEASEGNGNEDVRDEVTLPDEEVPSGTGTGTGFGIGTGTVTGNDSNSTAAPQETAKTDVGYVGTAGSAGAGAGAAAAAAAGTPVNANASAAAAAPGSAGEAGAESGAAVRSDDASATRAAGTSTSTNSGTNTSAETSPETVSEAERKEAADTTISRSTSTSAATSTATSKTATREATAPAAAGPSPTTENETHVDSTTQSTQPTTQPAEPNTTTTNPSDPNREPNPNPSEPPNLHEEQRSKALRARIRAALATYYRTTGTREPYNPVPGFELQLRNVAREAEPVPEHLNPDHLPLLSRRGEEGEGEGGGSRGRSPRRSVLIARYNDLYRQARSARTHPMLHGTLVRTIDEGFNEGDGEGNSNAVERPRLSDYETAHLTLSKIKAFRHLNSALHITARELARDVALLQRWVRLVLLGHRWVADSAGGPLEWQRRALPRFVERWRPFMAREVRYGVEGGVVRLEEEGFWRGGRRKGVEGAYVFAKDGRLVEKESEGWGVVEVFDVVGRWRGQR